MNASESMESFLTGLGAKRVRSNKDKYFLDGFDHEFYLIFDAEDNPERPDTAGTCNILISIPGEPPGDIAIRLVADCTRHKVMRFMFALGVERFSESTRKFLYANNSVIRTQDQPPTQAKG